MQKRLIDTNLIIRFLVNDNPKKASEVERLLKDSQSKNILLDMVVAEIIWVLDSYYKLGKDSIIEKVQALIHVESVKCNTVWLDRALSIWQQYNISFIDAYIAATAEAGQIPIYSYDLTFDKLKTIVRKGP